MTSDIEGRPTRGMYDLVKEGTDIVQLIGETVPLKKAGRGYVGLCPFHSEQTPSFHVDPERQTFKCFGCFAGGDCFSWLEKTRALTPHDALIALVDRSLKASCPVAHVAWRNDDGRFEPVINLLVRSRYDNAPEILIRASDVDFRNGVMTVVVGSPQIGRPRHVVDERVDFPDGSVMASGRVVADDELAAENDAYARWRASIAVPAHAW